MVVADGTIACTKPVFSDTDNMSVHVNRTKTGDSKEKDAVRRFPPFVPPVLVGVSRPRDRETNKYHQGFGFSVEEEA